MFRVIFMDSEFYSNTVLSGGLLLDIERFRTDSETYVYETEIEPNEVLM